MYLHKKEEGPGCRGGVAPDRFSDADYRLEIGKSCNADPLVLAVAHHTDALLELLNVMESELANMVYAAILRTAKELREGLNGGESQ